MSLRNPVQFAVVREDPDVELALLERFRRPVEALLVASGGCTALTVAALRPDVRLTLLDANLAQLDLVEKKVAALQAHGPGTSERALLFGVGRDDPEGFSCCGNFESLFRGFRAVLDDLVMPASDRLRLLRGEEPSASLTENPYWPVAFEMFFCDALLETMFGSDATQHAAKGSYPAYFRRVVEQGLSRPDRRRNYFLHHVLLGYYLEGATPAFLAYPCNARFTLLHASMAEAPSFARFSLVHLSNLFDWMDGSSAEAICGRLSSECAPGTVVVLRQLNNRTLVERFLGDAFRFDEALAANLLARDRSLFYERLLVGVKHP